MLILKPEVKTETVTREIWYAIGVVSAIHARLFGRPLCITSLCDGEHGARSLHYAGRAFDARTKDLSPETELLFYAQCKQALALQGFDVVLEHNPRHLHIEYDPKPGEHLYLLDGTALATAAVLASGS